MADKSFGIRQLNLIGGSGTANITSPNNLNLNASTVAISTDVTIGRHLDVDGHAEFDAVNVSGVSTSVQVRIGSNTIAASTAGDDLVIEGSSDRGLSIISGNASSSNIYFGDSDDTDVGRIAYQHNDNALDFSTNAGNTSIRIDSGGRIITGNYSTALDTTAGAIIVNGDTSGGRIVTRGSSTSADASLGELFGYWDTNKVAGLIFASGSDTVNKDDASIKFYTSSAGPSVTERLRIDGFGAIGLSGANYGTSGQVLTSQGSGSAPQWATPSGSTWTWDTSATALSGSTSSTITGIPSTAKIVLVHFNSISNDSNQDWIFRLGTSGGIVSSGYHVGSGYMFTGNTNRSTGFQMYATGTASHLWSGYIECVNIESNLWYCKSFFNAESDANTHYGIGKIDLGGTFDRVNFSTFSGTFDNGNIFVSYMEP